MNVTSKVKVSDSDQREQLVRRGSLHWVHWLVIILSIFLTIGAWWISSEQVSQKNLVKFNRYADQTIELVNERMRLYENALWGGVALIDANMGEMSHEQWLAYANSLRIDQVYPGINGIGVIYNIPPNQLDEFLASERKTRADFKLHPEHNEKEFWPITYIEPVAPNQKAVGLDMAFETNRYTSIKKSRDLGIAQLTGPISLVQDAKQTPGFLFYTPFYKEGKKPETPIDRRANIAGVTYAPFIMNKLMQGTLASENRQVRIKISDADVLLYDDEDSDSGSVNDRDETPLFTKKVDVEMYGRIWTFDMQSSLSFRNDSSTTQPYWILIGGMIIDSMLIGLFVFLTRANRTALAYADQMTIELEEKSSRLEKSNYDLEQFSYVASHDLKAPLNSIKQLISWIEEDCVDLLPQASKQHLEMLKSRSERMMKLLRDLLEYSQVSRTEYVSEIVPLQKLATDILFLHGSGNNFTCIAPDIELDIPRAPLEIVLRNLISNAIKHHHHKEGTITISYEVDEHNHLLRVQDDGPGIPDHFHSKVLEMFQTLKPRDQVEGSGMGLAMVKKIVEHHGGTFKIEQGRESGACFIIFWPCVTTDCKFKREKFTSIKKTRGRYEAA